MTKTINAASHHMILQFWFGEECRPRQQWFAKDPEFDAELDFRFLSSYGQAANGYLDHWLDAPDSSLALVLLLDQFPRNLFRNQAQAFDTDDKALICAKLAIEKGFDQTMSNVQRQFFYFPFEHSEDIEDQLQSLSLFGQFKDDPELVTAYDWALKHKEIIERFGRFPHRNIILGRPCTAEEKEFLKQPGSSF